MSSDLFAAFSSFDSPSETKPQKPTGSFQAPAAAQSDPFSLLASSGSHSQPQQNQQSMPWQSFQAPVPQPSSQKPQPWSLSQPQNAFDILGNGAAGGSSNLSEVKEEDDDAWGDFEMPSQSTNVTTTPPKKGPAVGSSIAPPGVSAGAPPRTRLIRASTIELMTNSLVDIGGPSSSSRLETSRDSSAWTTPKKQPEPRVKTPDPNLLFDADEFDGEAPPDDDDDDDEFGDFETVPSAAESKAPAPQPVIDLMSSDFAPQRTEARKAPPSQLLSGLTLGEGMSQYPTAPKSPSFQERTPFPSLGVTTPNIAEFKKDDNPASPSPVTAWPSLDENGNATESGQTNGSTEDWGVFEDFPSQPTQQKTAKKASAPPVQAPKESKPAPDWDWDASWEGDAVDTSKQQPEPAKPVTKSETGPPPTNVPPPSILLSLFPQLLGSINTGLFQPTSGQPTSIKDRVLSDPATIHFLNGYLTLATVAARVIAGRKLRWHRDKFLSQGMTISAATGGRRGMKLSGVDKSQASHEDREAADVAAVWKEIVGRLRSAVAAANSSLPAGEPRLRVPELSDSMAVQTAKGALTAPKACVVCGLKRDERVSKVDFEVEDSFGEWWVEFWGHRACRNFWLEHEANLRQR